MSDVKNLTKSQRKKLKQAEKRKASNSPDVDNGGHDTSGTKTPGVTDGHSTQDSRHRLSGSDSARYVQSVMSFNTTPIMNLGQQIPYGYQTPTMQTPQGQTPAVFTTPPTVSHGPPDWALPLINDVRLIKEALPKLEQIEKCVYTMSAKITAVEGKMSTLETKVREMEQSVSFIDSDYETQKSHIKENKDNLHSLKKVIHDMDETLKCYQKREETSTDKLLDLEARSMRENLIFYGIPETQPTNGQLAAEDCSHLVKELIHNVLNLDPTNMVFDRAHRLGGNRARRPRPIVVKFHRYSDRETVRLKAQDEVIKTALRGSNFGVGIQSPQQYREARKALSEHAKREEERGHRARIVGNKLFVNNKCTKKFVNGEVYDQ